MKTILLSIFLVVSFGCFGQSTNTARSAGLGNVSFFPGQMESLFGNQSGLADLESLSFLATSNRRFLISDLQTVGFGMAKPFKSGTIGLLVSQFGFSEYKASQAHLTYARKLMNNFNISGAFGFHRVNIPEYGASESLSYQIGISTKISNELALGLQVANPYQVENEEGRLTQTLFIFSMVYMVSEKVTAYFESEKNEDFNIRLRGGLEYLPIEKLVIRTGFESLPSSFHLGLGYEITKNLRFDLANSYNTQLGMTPTASLAFTVN